MYKRSNNPKVEELNKSYRERSYDLSCLNIIKIEQPDGKKPIRKCAWCTEGDLYHGSQKYCSPSCRVSAMAWAYPQKEEGLGMLLMRQDWKCNLCQFDYVPLIKQLIVNGRIYNKPDDFRTEYSWSLMKRLKQKTEPSRKPEVDHIVPVSKGGQSIGLENHQAICYTCHKTKTKVDNSGPRKKAKDESNQEGR